MVPGASGFTYRQSQGESMELVQQEAPPVPVRSKARKRSAGQPVRFEFRQDVGGMWLVAILPNGQESVIKVFSQSQADQDIVAALMQHGIPGDGRYIR